LPSFFHYHASLLFCAKSHFATRHASRIFWSPPQVQSQFLRLADLLDSSVQSFQTSQRVADLDGIDDAINALEQRSSDPSVTSLTLRSYLTQREQILSVVSSFLCPACFRMNAPPSLCVLTPATQVFDAAASEQVSQQPRRSVRIYPPFETSHGSEKGPRVIAIALLMPSRNVLPQGRKAMRRV
jgi:hypothetical protein